MKTLFKFKTFSKKQRKILNWWCDDSPVKDMYGIIADGAIRSGKTVSVSISYVIWAMTTFNNHNFGMCGKTIGSFRRNVLLVLKLMLLSRGYKIDDRRADNLLIISKGDMENRFYIFGGRDERSQDLIQGITLAGVFFDEVALMPESFVNQATGRCSVAGSKFWFNCNPEGPLHWFKVNWIDRKDEKRLLYLHFTMDDNNSLDNEIKERYKAMYNGVFYNRYIKGEWVVAEGVIYSMFDDVENIFDDNSMPPGLKNAAVRYITVDYGTVNPMVFLDCYDDGNVIWIYNEYYYSGKDTKLQKTDAQYANDFIKFATNSIAPSYVIIDPSAASFKAELRSKGYRIKEADNEVIDGIRITSTMIYKRKLKIHKNNCPNWLREVKSYIWDEKASLRGVEQPTKQDDHAMDATRYLCKTMVPARRITA